MMTRKKARIRIACMVAFGLAVSLVGPRFDGSPSTQAKTVTTYFDSKPSSGVFRYLEVINPADGSKSAKKSSGIAARKVESISTDDTYINNLGSTLSTQMLSFVSNSSASSAYISDVTGSELDSINDYLRQAGYEYGYKDIVTKIRFTIPAGILPASVTSSDDFLFYLEQAISRYPALCCLFTMGSYDNINNSLTVYSPVPKASLADTISAYQTTLDDMLKVPNANKTAMNEAEKLLYIHDQLVALTEYSVGRTGIYAADFIPAGAMLYNLSVCQSYAAVYNQAARALGLTSYVMYSDNHAWVAVRLGGYWYYIDPTWDDVRSVGESADMVKHKNFLIGKNQDSSFSAVHKPASDSDYASHFSEITSSLGSSYDDYYPKKNNITSQMCYANGGFYYSDNNGIYQWIRSSSQRVTITNLPTASSRRAAVLDGYLYISGSTGMYKTDPAGNQLAKIDSESYTGMYEAARKLYVSKGGAYSIYLDKSSPITLPSPSPTTNPNVSPLPSGYTPQPYTTASPAASAKPTSSSGIPTVPPLPTATIYDPTVVTPTPTGSATPMPSSTPYPDDDSFTTPAKTNIKTLKNSSTRAAYIKWKKIDGASKYQVQYSPSKSFSTKQIRVSMTSSVTIANLFKKTYYFRVRAVKVKRVNGVLAYKYGSWSAKKKLKIKK